MFDSFTGIRGIVAVNYWDGDEPYSLLVPWSIFSNQSRKELPGERLPGGKIALWHIGSLGTALRKLNDESIIAKKRHDIIVMLNDPARVIREERLNVGSGRCEFGKVLRSVGH